MTRIGMGTPRSHNRIQPTLPACFFKRVATMKSPLVSRLLREDQSNRCAHTAGVADYGRALFFCERGTRNDLDHCGAAAGARRTTVKNSVVRPASNTHANNAIE